MKKIKRGRPLLPPTQVIRIPVDKVATVEKLLGRKLANQPTAHIAIRVPTSFVQRIREAIQ